LRKFCNLQCQAKETSPHWYLFLEIHLTVQIEKELHEECKLKGSSLIQLQNLMPNPAAAKVFISYLNIIVLSNDWHPHLSEILSTLRRHQFINKEVVHLLVPIFERIAPDSQLNFELAAAAGEGGEEAVLLLSKYLIRLARNPQADVKLAAASSLIKLLGARSYHAMGITLEDHVSLLNEYLWRLKPELEENQVMILLREKFSGSSPALGQVLLKLVAHPSSDRIRTAAGQVISQFTGGEEVTYN